jgi:alpha-L-rhamnosidase
MAPYMGIADKGYGGESGPLGWELSFPILQKKLFEYYGDTSIIRENYAAVQKQIQFLRSKSIDGLFYWDISDHEALDPKPEGLSAAAFYYHHAILAMEFAHVLGRTKDSISYSTLATSIRNAIVRKYMVPGTGRFDNGTQSAQEFALWYHLSPEPEKTFDHLLEEMARHDWHTSSGIFGNKMMFDVLREQNRNDVAYKIANQKTYPGWGNMLANGATTLWETWAYPENFPSQNHPMFGSVDEWFYRSILGINGISPGFDSILIKPQPTGDLTWAKGEYNSVNGMIRSRWSISGKTFSLQISIPPNSHARAEIPSAVGTMVKKNGIPIADVQQQNGYAILQMGSGDYLLESTLK